VKAHPGDRLSFSVEAQEEEWNTVTLLKFKSSKGAFESVAPVLSFGLIQIDLPEVGTFQRVMPLEPDPGFLIYETRAVPITPTY
jgi:hypothetical protein